MQWWTSILNYFRREEPQAIDISLSDLRRWLFYFQDKVLAKHNVDKQILGYVTGLRQKRWQLECFLDEWQKKLPPAKRELTHNFFLETRKLLEIITFSHQPSVDELLKFQDILSEKLHGIIRKIEQSSFVHDFGYLTTETEPHHTPVNPLLHELMQLDNFRDQFEQGVIKIGLRTISALQKKRVKLDEVLQQMNLVNQKRSERNKWLKTTREKLREKQDQLDVLKANPLYKNYLEKKFAQQQAVSRKNDLEQEIVDFFKPLVSLLQEYDSDFNATALARKYSQEVLLAFSEDHGLAIVHILQHIKAQLFNDKYDLSPDQAYLVYGQLQKIEQGELEDLRTRLVSFKQNSSPILSQMGDPLLVSKIEELTYRYEHFNNQQIKIVEDVTLLENKLDQLKQVISDEVNMFQKLVRINFNQQINIFYDS